MDLKLIRKIDDLPEGVFIRIKGELNLLTLEEVLSIRDKDKDIIVVSKKISIDKENRRFIVCLIEKKYQYEMSLKKKEVNKIINKNKTIKMTFLTSNNDQDRYHKNITK